MWQRIEEQKSVSLNQVRVDWAEAVSFYRFLNNQRVKLAEVIENQIERFKGNTIEGHVLAVNNTTSINLHRQAGRLQAEGFGYLGGGAGKQIGFHLHPTLLIGAQSRHISGLSSVQIWTRRARFSRAQSGL